MPYADVRFLGVAVLYYRSRLDYIPDGLMSGPCSCCPDILHHQVRELSQHSAKRNGDCSGRVQRICGQLTLTVPFQAAHAKYKGVNKDYTLTTSSLILYLDLQICDHQALPKFSLSLRAFSRSESGVGSSRPNVVYLY